MRLPTVYVSEVILCAATTQPDSRSKLKYSTVYPMSGDCPDPVPPVPPVPGTAVILQEMVMEVARLSTILGLEGGCGKMEGQ